MVRWWIVGLIGGMIQNACKLGPDTSLNLELALDMIRGGLSFTVPLPSQQEILGTELPIPEILDIHETTVQDLAATSRDNIAASSKSQII